VQIELFIQQNYNELNLWGGVPHATAEHLRPGKPHLCFAQAGPGEQTFLSTLAGMVNDSSLLQSGSLEENIKEPTSDLPIAINSFDEELLLKSGFGLPKEKEIVEKGGTNSSEKLTVADLLKALGIDSSKLEGKAQIIEKLTVADLLKALGIDSSKLEGKAQIIDQAIEKATMNPEKGYGLGFEKLEMGVEKGGTNSGEKLTVADLLKALGVDSSKLEGKAQIIDQAIEKATINSEKGYGLGFEKLEMGVEKGGTNSSEKLTVADLLKALGVDSSKLEGKAQIIDQAIEKATINPEKGYGLGFEKLEVGVEKDDLIKRDLLLKLNSNVEREEIATKDTQTQEKTPLGKLDPQSIRTMASESGSFDKDFVNSIADKTGSDKGQDALLFSNNQSSGKVSDAVIQTKEIEAFQKQFQTDVLTQLIRRAVLNLRNGQTEIKIDLKPEFLGHIRMHISTENQQVLVRMLTEIPFVKEIIENNINQLKTDLQNQGLEVDKFEVFVSRDSDQYARGHENTESQKMQAQSDDNEERDGMLAEEREEIIQLTDKDRGSSLIGVFA